MVQRARSSRETKLDDTTSEPSRDALEFHVRGQPAGGALRSWTTAAVLAPVDLGRFHRSYWSSALLHLSRGSASFYQPLISLAAVESSLCVRDVFSRGLVTTPRRDAEPHETPPASLGEAYERLADGQALRLRQMETFMPANAPVIALVQDMQCILGHPLASLSCYISPANAPGLGPHQDDSEIFTLQVAGSKRWRLYHRGDPAVSCIHPPEMLSEHVHDVVLEPGDLLYVPSGTVHDVVNEEASFSLTIVFEPIRWRSVLDLLTAKLSRDPAFAKAMPSGALLGDRGAEALRGGFDARVGQIAEALAALGPEELAASLSRWLTARASFTPDAQFETLLSLRELELDTVVQRRAHLVWSMTSDGDTLTLVLPGGRTLSASRAVETALRRILTCDRPFPIREVHDSLGDHAKLALVGSLTRCGVLRRI